MEADHELAVFARLVARRAQDEPDRLAVVFESGEQGAELVRNRDLERHGNQVAWELRRAGLRSGDKVAVMLRNHPEFVYAMVAASKLGLVTVPIDPRARGDRLRYLLTFAGCQALVVQSQAAAHELHPGVPARRRRIAQPLALAQVGRMQLYVLMYGQRIVSAIP